MSWLSCSFLGKSLLFFQMCEASQIKQLVLCTVVHTRRPAWTNLVKHQTHTQVFRSGWSSIPGQFSYTYPRSCNPNLSISPSPQTFALIANPAHAEPKQGRLSSRPTWRDLKTRRLAKPCRPPSTSSACPRQALGRGLTSLPFWRRCLRWVSLAHSRKNQCFGGPSTGCKSCCFQQKVVF